MTGYTVKQLSALSGVSVRTLHHYDKLGLLKPEKRSEAGYRFYGRKELLRLQQILFYRELEFPLEKIKELLDDPDFDLIQSLKFHREELKRRSTRLKQLLVTVDKTIVELKNKKQMITDQELYSGFEAGQGEAYRAEASEKWSDDEVAATEERLRKLSKTEWETIKQQGENNAAKIALLTDLDPSSAEVQEAIAEHYRFIGNFYEVSEERYRGLAQLYAEDERFRAYYDKHRAGLADFICKAIGIFCDNGMKV